jgi:hypothetical protein
MPGEFGVSTYRDRTIYLHLLNVPTTILKLPPLSAQITGCSVLTGGKASCVQTVAGLDVSLTDPSEAVDTIVALSLSTDASDVRPIRTTNDTSPLAPIAKED